VVKVLTNTNARWPSPQLRWARSNRSGRPRCQDITARYGGEEFAVVLPNTALRQALTVADHIRRAVMAKELKKKSTGEILGRVTISVGVCMLKLGDQRPQPRHLRSRSYAAETQSQVG
jgi:diguanylate cyclase (GGDEF)-like protein